MREKILACVRAQYVSLESIARAHAWGFFSLCPAPPLAFWFLPGTPRTFPSPRSPRRFSPSAVWMT